MESQKEITEIYKELSYDELTDALNEYLTGESSEEEETSEAAETETTATTSNTSFKKQETADAFDDLFNS